MNTQTDVAYRPEPPLTFARLAEAELRKLEDINPGSTLPIAHVLARGFAAVAYAVLAVRDACEDQGADLSNTLADVAAAAAGDTAGDVRAIADAAALAALPGRPPGRWRSRLQRVRVTHQAEGPLQP